MQSFEDTFLITSSKHGAVGAAAGSGATGGGGGAAAGSGTTGGGGCGACGAAAACINSPSVNRKHNSISKS